MTSSSVATAPPAQVLREQQAPVTLRRGSRVWRELRQNRLAAAGVVFLIAIVLAAIGAPLLTHYAPERQDLLSRLEPPSAAHWLGTDEAGRDVFARLAFGARISLFVALLGTAGGVIAGTLVGLIAGFFGGWTDTLTMRVVDVMYAFPGVLLVILIVSVLGPSLWNLILALTIWGTPTLSRIVRASVLSLKSEEYITAARTIGATRGRLMSGFQPGDPRQLLPVLDDIYAGPQTNRAPASFAGYTAPAHQRPSHAARGFWQAQALAELGCAVVMIDGLGMPYRSKAFHDRSFRQVGDGGIEDHIHALRQLAARHPYLDLERVGIYGHSAGGYASAHAMLRFPEFFKVGVSSAGNHDHRLDKATWIERYMGLPVGDYYAEQANATLAHRLSGKLLLIHGEMDENVHVASTLQRVDALIKANKDFDLLILPNRPHACTDDPYFIRKRWDYFVRHLLGAEPPRGYRLADPPTAGQHA
jgi:dienelactone hydrolase/ABC-type phosphate/phosphonate transport system permease subunit